MKKGSKILALAAVGMLVIGAGAAFAGWKLGADLELVYIPGEGIHTSSYHTSETILQHEQGPLEQFQNMDFKDTDYFNYELIPSDHFGYEISYYKNNKPELLVEDGTLKIVGNGGRKQTPKRPYHIISLHGFVEEAQEEEKIIIYYPEDIKLENFNFDSRYSFMSIESLSLGQMSISGDYNGYRLDNVSVANQMALHGDYSVYDLVDVSANQIDIQADYGEYTSVGGKSSVLTVNSNYTDFYWYAEHLGEVTIQAQYGFMEFSGTELSSLQAESTYVDYTVAGTLTGDASWNIEYGEIALHLDDIADFGYDVALDYGSIINNTGKTWSWDRYLDDLSTVATSSGTNGNLIQVTGSYSDLNLNLEQFSAQDSQPHRESGREYAVTEEN